jgi:predicted dehydrogenase
MSTLKVGIAGYGLVGKRRRVVIDQHPAMKTVAVCDRYYETRGVFDDGVRYYPNFTQLLEENLDVLFVCMTPDIAPEVTIAGLNRGLHVFCEKPPGRTVEDVERVIQVERAHPRLKLKYGFNHRYHDSVRDALRIVESGELGRLINMRGVYGKSLIGELDSWRTKRSIAGGGILLDQGIHMLDLMVRFAGPFEEIKSFISNGFWNHDVEDNAYALLRTGGGIHAMLHSTATQWRHRFSLELSLAKGGLVLAGILSGTKSYGQETLLVSMRGDNDAGNPKEILTSYIEDNSWRDEACDFADAIVNDRKVAEGTSADALCVMDHVHRIYRSDDDWRKML